MFKYKAYVKVLSLILIGIFGGAFIYFYLYAKNYPIPLSHRVSLDAKMMFIRDMPNRENIDTIVVGSSIGLNNIQGTVLEASSEKVNHVINLSSFSLEVTHWEQLWDLLSMFPNAKRVIYSGQSLDFTEESDLREVDIDFMKEYTELGEKSIDLKYSFYTYKHLIQCIKRQWVWQEKYMSNNNFTYIGFDSTGSAPLHIYGADIVKKRWNNPYVANTTKESYMALERIIKRTKESGMTFYLAIQPYRVPLIKKDKHLRDILEYFHCNAGKTALDSGGKVLNLHEILYLDDKYFADRIHLNDKGSVLTSREIGRFIDESE